MWQGVKGIKSEALEVSSKLYLKAKREVSDVASSLVRGLRETGESRPRCLVASLLPVNAFKVKDKCPAVCGRTARTVGRGGADDAYQIAWISARVDSTKQPAKSVLYLNGRCHLVGTLLPGPRGNSFSTAYL